MHTIEFLFKDRYKDIHHRVNFTVEGDEMFSQTWPSVESDARLVQNPLRLVVLRKIIMHLNQSRNSSLFPCIAMLCSLSVSFLFWGYSSNALFFHINDHAVQMHTAPAQKNAPEQGRLSNMSHSSSNFPMLTIVSCYFIYTKQWNSAFLVSIEV